MNSVPRLEPVVVVDAQHHAGLVVEPPVAGRKRRLEREVAADLMGEEVPVGVAEAVERVVPPVGVAPCADLERSSPTISWKGGGLIQRRASLLCMRRSVHLIALDGESRPWPVPRGGAGHGTTLHPRLGLCDHRPDRSVLHEQPAGRAARPAGEREQGPVQQSCAARAALHGAARVAASGAGRPVRSPPAAPVAAPAQRHPPAAAVPSAPPVAEAAGRRYPHRRRGRQSRRPLPLCRTGARSAPPPAPARCPSATTTAASGLPAVAADCRRRSGGSPRRLPGSRSAGSASSACNCRSGSAPSRSRSRASSSSATSSTPGSSRRSSASSSASSWPSPSSASPNSSAARALTNAAQIAAALAAASIATLYACSYYASVELRAHPRDGRALSRWRWSRSSRSASRNVFGRIVAVVGLIGGYVTPALFSSDEPSAFVLFGYLTVVLAGIFVLIRMRDWWAIALPALLGPLLWMMAWSTLDAAEAQAWLGRGLCRSSCRWSSSPPRRRFWLAADAPLKIGDDRGPARDARCRARRRLRGLGSWALRPRRAGRRADAVLGRARRACAARRRARLLSPDAARLAPVPAARRNRARLPRLARSGGRRGLDHRRRSR